MKLTRREAYFIARYGIIHIKLLALRGDLHVVKLQVVNAFSDTLSS